MRRLVPARLKNAVKGLVSPTTPRGWAPDEFVGWLSFANAGMLEMGNVAALDHAIANLPTDDPMVEIGTFAGLSANLIGYLRDKHGKPNDLFTSDAWKFEHAGAPQDTIGQSHVTWAEYAEHVRSSFVRNAQLFSTRPPHAIELLSDEFFRSWSRGASIEDVFGRQVRLGGPISLCHIDGDHTEVGARADYVACDEHLVVGGFLMFDDSSRVSPFGVRPVVKQALSSGRYERVMECPNVLLRKVK